MNWTLILALALSVLAGAVVAYTGFVIGVDRGQIDVLKMIDSMPFSNLLTHKFAIIAKCHVM